jgi:hypothetical protein
MPNYKPCWTVGKREITNLKEKQRRILAMVYLVLLIAALLLKRASIMFMVSRFDNHKNNWYTFGLWTGL